MAAEQEPGKEKEKEKEKETPEVDAIPEMDIEAQARRLLRAYHALRAAPDLYRMLTSPPTDSDLSPTENQTTS